MSRPNRPQIEVAYPTSGTYSGNRLISPAQIPPGSTTSTTPNQNIKALVAPPMISPRYVDQNPDAIINIVPYEGAGRPVVTLQGNAPTPPTTYYGYGQVIVSGQSTLVANIYLAPLIFNAGNNINITTDLNSGNITFSANISAMTPGGSNTELQFNNSGHFGGVPGVGYSSGNLTLGNISNVKITGGANNQILSTDGAGNLKWANNGVPGGTNTTVQFNNNGSFSGIPFATYSGGHLSLGSNANIIISGGTNGQVLSTNGSGNLTWINSGGVPGGSTTQLQFNNNGNFAGIPSATYSSGKLHLGYNSNITITGGANGEFLTTDGTGNLYWSTNTPNFGPDLTVGTFGDDVGVFAGPNAEYLSLWWGGNYPTDQPNVGITLGDTAGESVKFNTLPSLGNNNVIHFYVQNQANTGASNWLMLSNGALMFPDQTMQFTASQNRLANLSDVTLTSPSNGQVLTYNSGTSKWINGSIIGLPSRQTVSVSTTSLANGASYNANVNVANSYALYSITVSAGAWVTVYSSNVARTNDASRAMGTDPTAGTGVLAEIIESSAGSNAVTQLLTPPAICFSSESPPNHNAPLKITNISGSTATISVTLTYLQMEA
jgi:hypothetical protein